MENYLSKLSSGARTGLCFLIGFWVFVGLIVLVLGMYPKAAMIFILACLVGICLFLYLIIEILKPLKLMVRFFTALIVCGSFLLLNIVFIQYALSINYNTIVNCGKDAHEYFWSPFSSNCKKNFLYNINPFNP